MSVFKTQNPLNVPHNALSFLSIFARTLTSSSSQTTQNKNKKRLSDLFDEMIRLGVNAESESDGDRNDDLKNGLKELGKEVRQLKAESKNRTNLNVNVKEEKTKDLKSLGLSSLFISKWREKEEMKAKRREERRVLKELSPDMELLVGHLHKEGYFEKANFLSGDRKKLDLSRFNDNFSRDFVRFAAYQYGKDHQELAKWLSGGDLKKVVEFGCPSLARKNVFAAKELRHYFDIQEDTVCSKCVIKDLCQFANKQVWKDKGENLNLAIVMRVLTLYALELVPPELAVPDDVKASVSRLLNDIINLSRTTKP